MKKNKIITNMDNKVWNEITMTAKNEELRVSDFIKKLFETYKGIKNNNEK